MNNTFPLMTNNSYSNQIVQITELLLKNDLVSSPEAVFVAILKWYTNHLITLVDIEIFLISSV